MAMMMLNVVVFLYINAQFLLCNNDFIMCELVLCTPYYAIPSNEEPYGYKNKHLNK